MAVPIAAGMVFQTLYYLVDLYFVANLGDAAIAGVSLAGNVFTHDPAVVAVGSDYLQVISWNFVATGLIFSCSSLFQALGNTWPSLISSGSRIITYVIPAIWLGSHGHFELRHLWYLSVCTVALQAVLSLLFLMRQFRQSLAQRPQPVVT